MTAARSIAVEACMGLDTAAARLGCCAKTLATFLRKNPQFPPLFAKPGRDYIISPADLDRIYVLMQHHFGAARIFNSELEAKPAAPRPPAENGHVYFIQGVESRLVKIGWAVDPARRLKTLRTGSAEPLRLLATMPGTRFTERDLHKTFSAHRVRGEWFLPKQAILSVISAAKRAK